MRLGNSAVTIRCKLEWEPRLWLEMEAYGHAGPLEGAPERVLSRPSQACTLCLLAEPF